MSNHIVIGANFGDEGKGLVTDYLAAGMSDSIVVRFNGGGQAAHTVELDDGRRHVFHHMGSGTLRGRPSLLSEHFIVNPMVFNREFIEVPEDHVKVFAHRKALLTTPYDWLLNQRIESKRGEQQHGTTGMGINEVVTRTSGGYMDKNREDGIRSEACITRLEDIYDTNTLKHKLESIRTHWVPQRAKQLGINPEYIMEYDMTNYLEDCRLMSQLVVSVGNYNILKHFEDVIFEGAQGLLLDEEHYFFPHVTRSKTGVFNAMDILHSINETHADVHYVTRSYLTRHGNGPLPLEGEVKEKEDITNRPNKHQHELRFAPLHIPLLEESITRDLRDNKGIILNPNIKVTWADHREDLKGHNDYIYGEKLDDELLKIIPKGTLTKFYSKTGETI